MKIICWAIAVSAASLGMRAWADDAAGFLRVDAGTNALAVAGMPFAPLDESGPGGYLSGLFSGDGGPLSDRLLQCLAGKIDKAETLFLKGGYLHTLADT